MYILGLSCFYHDSAAVLLCDGVLVAAAAEERFSRHKHDDAFPYRAIQFCLNLAGIRGTDLDYVVFYEKPFVKFERILLTALDTFPASSRAWSEMLLSWSKEKLWIKSLILKHTGISADRVLFCDHHMSHAASAFFASPFREAAVLTVDGVGEWTTTTIGTARSRWESDLDGENRIDLTDEMRFPHSLGLLYSTFTAWLGFRVNDGEYKVMGMATYGQPRYIDRIMTLFHQNADDGSFRLDLDYFSFHRSINRSFSHKFVGLFGEPRAPEAPFSTPLSDPGTTADRGLIERSQYYADVAASIQAVTEEALLTIARSLQRRTQLRHLVMAGGVALNARANFRLLTETPFEDVYIQPAAGDDGGALGAALWIYHVVLGKPRRWIMPHAYWGQGYTRDECRAFLDARNLAYESFGDRESTLLDIAADALAQGKVLGLFQGRFEWGPRALGNRSILADPRSAAMKDVVNTRIKFREPFRPFAPTVLREAAPDYFDFPDVDQCEATRYMLMVSPIIPDRQASIAAVSHLGTARLQTLDRETNPCFYGIIERFGQATGVPMVLNTSFNRRGEPIVASPDDAWNTFCGSQLDLLIMEDLLVRRQ